MNIKKKNNKQDSKEILGRCINTIEIESKVFSFNVDYADAQLIINKTERCFNKVESFLEQIHPDFLKEHSKKLTNFLHFCFKHYSTNKKIFANNIASEFKKLILTELELQKIYDLIKLIEEKLTNLEIIIIEQLNLVQAKTKKLPEELIAAKKHILILTDMFHHVYNLFTNLSKFNEENLEFNHIMLEITNYQYLIANLTYDNPMHNTLEMRKLTLFLLTEAQINMQLCLKLLPDFSTEYKLISQKHDKIKTKFLTTKKNLSPIKPKPLKQALSWLFKD